MNRDHHMTPESCAKEILAGMAKYDAEGGLALSEVTAIIQRCVSSEVAKVHGEYQKLAEKWKSLPYGLGGGYRAACASEVEALAPNKEIVREP